MPQRETLGGSSYPASTSRHLSSRCSRDGRWPHPTTRRPRLVGRERPPGTLRGGTLVTGHTVHSGGGALDDLETLRRGDPVLVRTTRGVVGYSVTGVTVSRKASLARVSDRVFSQAGPHRLVLVTCEDWNGVEYLGNVVVLAEPTPERRSGPAVPDGGTCGDGPRPT